MLCVRLPGAVYRLGNSRCAVESMPAYPTRAGGGMDSEPNPCPKVSHPPGRVACGERPPGIPETPKPGRAEQQGATRLTGGS